MTFIDTNAFVPLFKEDIFTKIMDKFFENPAEGLKASCASLIELRFVLKKLGKTNEEVEQAIGYVLSLPIEFVDINSNLIEESFNYMKEFNTEFFDSIIVSSMVEEQDFSIISFDTDFDKIDFIKRIELK